MELLAMSDAAFAFVLLCLLFVAGACVLVAVGAFDD
jgi:hypothetical protein